jgi:hypothetical protein
MPCHTRDMNVGGFLRALSKNCTTGAGPTWGIEAQRLGAKLDATNLPALAAIPGVMLARCPRLRRVCDVQPRPFPSRAPGRVAHRFDGQQHLPETLNTRIWCSRMNRNNSCSGADGPPFRDRWRTGFWCLGANCTVFFEPPVSAAPMEKTTVPSESRTFHSVCWTYSALGVSFNW